MEKPLHKIEWIALILLALIVDIIQILLNVFFGSGIIFNRFISLAAGIIFNGYLWFRGKEVMSGKQFVNALATMAGEQIPVADFIPFWTISLIASYLVEKSKLNPETTLGKIGSGVKKVSAVAKKVTIKPDPKSLGIKPPPLNVGGIRPPRKS